MKNWLINNLWIKIISLVLAIITWFYVNGELDKEKYIARSYYKSPYLMHAQEQSSQETKPMNRGYVVEKETE
ncbi:MAG: hypothetical protein QGI05_04825 [Candidatus Omnitrophota bacterium]|jgi:hypothetical protein|nr:hypothetical protein [Candidatus Omnitrophota bacterium]